MSITSSQQVTISFFITIFRELGGINPVEERHTVETLAQKIASIAVPGAIEDKQARNQLPLISGCRFGNRRSMHGSLRHNETCRLSQRSSSSTMPARWAST
jgi:hypothetical protein